MRKLLMIFAGFYLSLYGMLHILHLQFINPEVTNVLMMVFAFAIPAFIIASLIYTVSSEDSIGIIVGKIIATLVAAGICGITVSYILFMFWIFDNPGPVEKLFANRNDISRNIVLRNYGGFGPDSTPSTEMVEENKFANFLVRYTKVDTNEIDRSEWIRVK